jgi:hypothetical protein
MNRDQRRAAKSASKQSNAEMIYNILRTEKTPRDAAATISAVIAALVWDIEPDDEAKASKLAAEMTASVVELWKVNRAAVAQMKQ